MKMNNKKTVHISIDDVIEIFKDLTLHENTYKCIWENPILETLKQQHNLYGAVFSLYVYFENDTYSIDRTTAKFHDEFKQNSNWLKFGFHAYSEQRDYCDENEELLYMDYCKTVNELERIVGEEAIDRMIRIHRFAAGRKAVGKLEGLIDGLLTADDGRISYSLSDGVCKYINGYGHYRDVYGIQYIRTDIRLEWVEGSVKSLLDHLLLSPERKHFEIFSHEWCWLSTEIKNRLTILCDEISKKEDCEFSYYSSC